MATHTLSELAALCGASLDGDGDRAVVGPAALDEAGPDQVSFLAQARYEPLLRRTRAAAVLVRPEVERPRPELTLLRFYILHIVVFPLVMLALIYLHFSSIRRVGLDSSDPSATAAAGVTFREHVLNLAILLTVLAGTLITLGILAPRGLPAAADPYATLPGIPPPWYLLAPFGFFELTADWLPRWVAGAVLLVATLLFVLVPFWTRSLERRTRARGTA